MKRIDSPLNDKVKLAASLSRQRAREKEKSFIVEGIRLAEEALKAVKSDDCLSSSPWEIRFGFVTADALEKERGEKIVLAAEKIGIPLFEVPETVYKKAAQVVAPQGILFVVKMRQIEGKEIFSQAEKNVPLIAVLDSLQDPGNVGTLIRTAEAVGATGAILLNTADIYGEKIVRSSAGTIFRLPMVKMSKDEFVSFAKESQIPFYAAVLDKKALPHFLADFSRPAMIAFGSEGNGVSPEIVDMAKPIYIPMQGKNESLNVAQAAAIILYEAFRQRYYTSSGDLI